MSRSQPRISKIEENMRKENVMAKQTPRQKRQAIARKLEKSLPAKGGKGETVLPNAFLRKTINSLRK